MLGTPNKQSFCTDIEQIIVPCLRVIQAQAKALGAIKASQWNFTNPGVEERASQGNFCSEL